jgi:hypothetical protein
MCRLRRVNEKSNQLRFVFIEGVLRWQSLVMGEVGFVLRMRRTSFSEDVTRHTGMLQVPHKPSEVSRDHGVYPYECKVIDQSLAIFGGRTFYKCHPIF